MKIIVVQQSAHTDQITEDGTELTKLPYPFEVAEDGTVENREFWRGKPARIIGFQRRVDERHIDLPWHSAVSHPEAALGMYVISSNDDGSWWTHDLAVQSVKVFEVPS